MLHLRQVWTIIFFMQKLSTSAKQPNLYPDPPFLDSNTEMLPNMLLISLSLSLSLFVLLKRKKKKRHNLLCLELLWPVTCHLLHQRNQCLFTLFHLRLVGILFPNLRFDSLLLHLPGFSNLGFVVLLALLDFYLLSLQISSTCSCLNKI